MATIPNQAAGGRPAMKENNINNLKGTSVGNANGKSRESRNQKRTVLGSITNNVRVQPSRAAKLDSRQDENAGIPQKVFCSKSRNQPFSIFVDQEPPKSHVFHQSNFASASHDDIENQEPSLVEAVAQLPSLHPPSLPMGEEPCFLDMSGVEDVVVEVSDEEDIAEQENVCMSTVDTPMSKAEREAYIEEVPEYSADIYRYLQEVEGKNYPQPGFMKRQEDVTVAMRSILVDWLVEVAEEYKLQRETLFLTVCYIDRFLSQMNVLRSKLQLVGAAAMFLASKYEEIYPPDVNEFVYITDDTYHKKQILRMEHLILKVLKFDLATPTINWFCERLQRVLQADETQLNLAMYMCELVLVDHDKFLAFPPSIVAASAVCLASYTLGLKDIWGEQCVQQTRYSLPELMPCIQMLYDLHCRSEHLPQQAVREKYRQQKYHSVADLPPQPMLCLM